MRAQMFSRERVRSFADAQLARLPSGVLDGVDACLAGGAFRALLHAPPAPAPRDLDLWPRTSRDEETLLQRLAPHATRVRPGRWNTQLQLSCGLEVDVVRARGRGLQETVAQFDIALAAVGARARRPGADAAAPADDKDSVVVHPAALSSLEARQLLLLPGALDGVNALGTAERLLRCARELRWPRPADALRRLEEAFRAAAPERRAALLKAYRSTSMGGEDAAEVARLFGLDRE